MLNIKVLEVELPYTKIYQTQPKAMTGTILYSSTVKIKDSSCQMYMTDECWNYEALNQRGREYIQSVPLIDKDKNDIGTIDIIFKNREMGWFFMGDKLTESQLITLQEVYIPRGLFSMNIVLENVSIEERPGDYPQIVKADIVKAVFNFPLVEHASKILSTEEIIKRQFKNNFEGIKHLSAKGEL